MWIHVCMCNVITLFRLYMMTQAMHHWLTPSKLRTYCFNVFYMRFVYKHTDSQVFYKMHMCLLCTYT